MEKTHVTIKDIARKLNLSASTVSRALRNHPDIKEETKKRVRALAEELDYQPDTIAQSLKNRRTNMIGVIVPEIRHEFFSGVISGIEDVAYKSGYAIIVSQSNENYERERINVNALISNRVAGLLISISQSTRNSDHFRLLERQGIPFVFFDRVCEDIDASKVVVDDYDGAMQAVGHLIERGYRKIAHLAGPSHLSITQQRLEGYLSALNKHNISPDERLIVYGGLNEEDGYTGFESLWASNRQPDAVFAVNDPVAIGAFSKIKELKLRIPQDVALVGFSDNPITALVDPPISTVSQPVFQLGQTAAEILIKQIQLGEEFVPRREILKTRLIVRHST
ncbi:MAG: LacI family DNA-binding transcriptional regulator [Fidelibacterota bacterium]